MIQRFQQKEWDYTSLNYALIHFRKTFGEGGIYEVLYVCHAPVMVKRELVVKGKH